MKVWMILLLSTIAMAETPGKVFTFNKNDTEHCKVIVIDGKPLLESTYEGTSVAIAMPVNRGDGEFLVFVAVSRAASGTIRVNPKDFYGLYPNAAHSRLSYLDKAAETEQETRGQPADPGLSASNAQLDPHALRPGQVIGGASPAGAPPGDGPEAGAQHTPMPASAAFLRAGKVKQGEKIAGWVALREAGGAKTEARSTDTPDEIDIPVNGIVFRF